MESIDCEQLSVSLRLELSFCLWRGFSFCLWRLSSPRTRHPRHDLQCTCRTPPHPSCAPPPHARPRNAHRAAPQQHPQQQHPSARSQTTMGLKKLSLRAPMTASTDESGGVSADHLNDIPSQLLQACADCRPGGALRMLGAPLALNDPDAPTLMLSGCGAPLAGVRRLQRIERRPRPEQGEPTVPARSPLAHLTPHTSGRRTCPRAT